MRTENRLGGLGPGRCGQGARGHIIGDYDNCGGIDSPPSFQFLAPRHDPEERVHTIDARPPHPVFGRVPGVARRSNALAYTAEFTVAPDDIENLNASVLTFKNSKRRQRARAAVDPSAAFLLDGAGRRDRVAGIGVLPRDP